MSIIITNIQRMCMHDGPGIRTTVFLKGCSICCPWCANPENLSAQIQYYFDESKCKKSAEVCPYNQKCVILDDNKSGIMKNDLAKENVICPVGAIGMYGKKMPVDEIYNEIIKDQVFWDKSGGVTFSGGEALLQIDDLLELMRLLKQNKIHIAVESALFVSGESVKKALDYVDLFIIDVKILDKNRCKEILGGNIDQYIKNVKTITTAGKTIIFRVPCSDEYTMDEKNRILLLKFFLEYKQYPIEIFKLHNLGKKKYKTLGIDIGNAPICDNISTFYEELKKNGNEVSIISI